MFFGVSSKPHLHSKIIVFLLSCKQVRFVFETFCKMHPGVLFSCKESRNSQQDYRCVKIFTTTSHAVHCATDIATSDLDFPSVGWVVQLDAPEDADMYIHHVGRTARYESKGKGLLSLMPSEEEEGCFTIQSRPRKTQKYPKSTTKPLLSGSRNQVFQPKSIVLFFLRSNVAYIHSRFQEFVLYIRSVYPHKDNSVFKIKELPVDLFAELLGLSGTPKINLS